MARSSKGAPETAMVAIRHHGYWFYISADDAGSKHAFSLLRAVMNLAMAETDSSQSPLLTIPVGR